MLTWGCLNRIREMQALLGTESDEWFQTPAHYGADRPYAQNSQNNPNDQEPETYMHVTRDPKTGDLHHEIRERPAS